MGFRYNIEIIDHGEYVELDDSGLLILLELLTVGIALILGILIVILAAIAANKLLRPPRRVGSWTPRDLGFDFEDVEVETGDGTMLKGWFIDRGSRSTIIAIHGYTSSRWDETYMKPVIKILAEAGYNVAAFDFRAHGESGGEYTTLGYHERRDIMDIITWLKENRKDRAENIGLIGYSMGGAVTIMVSSMDDRVSAGVADSPYINIVSSGKRWIKRFGEPLRTLLLISYPLIIRFVSGRAGIDPEELNMMRYAEKIGKPLLVIAGRRDDLVHVSEALDFCKVAHSHNKNVERWITDSRHVESIRDYPDEYRERVVGFFERWVPK